MFCCAPSAASDLPLVVALGLSQTDHANDMLVSILVNVVRLLQSVKSAVSWINYSSRRSDHVTTRTSAYIGFVSWSTSSSRSPLWCSKHFMKLRQVSVPSFVSLVFLVSKLSTLLAPSTWWCCFSGCPPSAVGLQFWNNLPEDITICSLCKPSMEDLEPTSSANPP